MTEKLRWTRAVAVLAVIAAVLVAVAVVTNRGAHRRAAADRAARPHATTMMTSIRIPDAPIVGPVPLGGILKLSGENGFLVQLQAVGGTGPGAPSFTVHLQNLGLNAFDGALRTGVWLATDENTLIGPTVVRPSASTVARDSQADPGDRLSCAAGGHAHPAADHSPPRKPLPDRGVDPAILKSTRGRDSLSPAGWVEQDAADRGRGGAFACCVVCAALGEARERPDAMTAQRLVQNARFGEVD